MNKNIEMIISTNLRCTMSLYTMLVIFAIINDELSVGLIVTFIVYSIELYLVNGRNSKLIMYGGDMVTCRLSLLDQMPTAVTLVSTL